MVNGFASGTLIMMMQKNNKGLSVIASFSCHYKILFSVIFNFNFSKPTTNWEAENSLE